MMKRKTLASAVLILFLAACSSPAQTEMPANTAAAQQQAAQVTPTSQSNYPAPATQAADPTNTAEAAAPTQTSQPTAYPAPEATAPAAAAKPITPLADSTRYGVAKVDEILDAVLGGKIDAIPGLIAYTQIPCTTKDDASGFPKCQGDKTDGTLLAALPTLGPQGQGGFILKSDDVMVDLVGQVELVGVFSVKSDAKSEQYFPAGKYGVVLHFKNTVNLYALRVSDDGIVRVDFLEQVPDNTTQPDLDSFLKPK